MGEIRSTLDIIMEKTKGLTISEAEKKAFKEEEMSGKIKGLIQKSLDGLLDMEGLKTDLATLAEKDETMAKRLVREESLSKIQLGENNEPILRILEETTGLDAMSVRKALKDLEGRLEQEKGVCEKKLIKSLDKKGISGSAVLPNIQADDAWNQHVSKIRGEFRERLNAFMENQAS